MFYLDDGQLEDLTFSVYGKAISMIGIEKGKSYTYDVKPLECEDALLMPLQDGFASHEVYGQILQDICYKRLISEGFYSVVIF